MPRITRPLPERRADYSFGDLVYWHLFKFGTRPSVDPNAESGRHWESDAVEALLDVTDRTLLNWIFDRNLPDSVVPLSNLLFGDEKRWDAARAELQEKFEKGWAAKRTKRVANRTKAPKDGRLHPAEPAAASASEAPVQGESSSSASTPGAASTGAGQEPPDPAQPERDPTPQEQPQPEPEPSRELRAAPPTGMLPPGRKSLPRWVIRSLIAGIALLVGVYTWIQSARNSGQSVPRQPDQTAKATLPQVPPPPVLAQDPPRRDAAPPPQQQAVIVPAQPLVSSREPPSQPDAPEQPPAPEVRSELPVQAQPVPPAVQPEPTPSPEPQLQDRLFAARQAAHDAEVRRREEAARRADRDAENADQAQRQREAEARTIAGLGFRLRENVSPVGSGFNNFPVAGVTDCALACVRESCDVFAYDRGQTPAAAARRRYCYLYREPFTLRSFPGHVLGERVADPPHTEPTARLGAISAELPARTAQNIPPPASAGADDLTRCATGPVKVTGFNLTCDRIMGGGTTLGSSQLSYTVANINECAAKCRPITRCVGFTFNAASPTGRHACMIFGPTPETRESKGWISGTR